VIEHDHRPSEFDPDDGARRSARFPDTQTFPASPQAGAVDASAASADDVVKTYGRAATTVTALDHVSVGFAAGQLTAVMGPSGSGKSTLLHCLAGLDTVDSGRLVVGGTEVSALDERGRTRLRRERLGFVFQAFNLLPTLTAAENIELPLALARRAPEAAWRERVVAAVGLADRLHHRPAELSGGQQQRVAVARALIGQPDLVFADEPTGNLDSRASAEVLGFLRRSVEELGQTVVMVTHDPFAAGHADRVVFLADGHIVDQVLDPGAEQILDRMRALGG
jgi:putative ABC transport system ATP-binding protein